MRSFRKFFEARLGGVNCRAIFSLICLNWLWKHKFSDSQNPVRAKLRNKSSVFLSSAEENHMQIGCGISEFSWMDVISHFTFCSCFWYVYRLTSNISLGLNGVSKKIRLAEMCKNAWAKNFFAGSVSCCRLSCINYKSKGIVWDDVVVQSFCSYNIASKAFYVRFKF